MRLISQDMRTDIPYDQFALVIRFENGIGWVIAALPCGVADRQTRFHMGVYSKKELAYLEASKPIRTLINNENPFIGVKQVFYQFRSEEKVQEEYDHIMAENGETTDGNQV